ncbi:MAG: GcrA family cell cycle regulator [Alphaproteobacteria bacterium]|nr:GcrA family cell cycle regulator [Alphaproteobacteria bacterium]
MKDSIWDDNLVDKLKDLYLNKSMTAVNIGNELGFSKNAIIGKIHRLQLNQLRENYLKEQDTLKNKETQLQMETIFNIDTDNIKTVINIAKKSNTIINQEKKSSALEVFQQESSNDPHKVNLDVFQLHTKDSKLGKYKLADIEFNMCVWPYGEEDFTFCGAKTSSGKSYCDKHLDLVYFVTKKLPKKKYATLEEEEVELEEVEEFEEEEAEL